MLRRLADDLFRLRPGLARQAIQTFANDRIRLAVVGEGSAFVPQSPALRGFIHESNRGDHLRFVADLDDLALRLAR